MCICLPTTHRCVTPRPLWSTRHPPPRSARTSCSISSRGASTRRRLWVSVGDGSVNGECGDSSKCLRGMWVIKAFTGGGGGGALGRLVAMSPDVGYAQHDCHCMRFVLFYENISWPPASAIFPPPALPPRGMIISACRRLLLMTAVLRPSPPHAPPSFPPSPRHDYQEISRNAAFVLLDNTYHFCFPSCYATLTTTCYRPPPLYARHDHQRLLP